MASQEGIITLKLGGRERKLKFKMATWSLYPEVSGYKFEEMGQAWKDNWLKFIIDVTTSALRADAEINETGEKYNTTKVADWIDDLSESQTTKLLETIMKSQGLGKIKRILMKEESQ